MTFMGDEPPRVRDVRSLRVFCMREMIFPPRRPHKRGGGAGVFGTRMEPMLTRALARIESHADDTSVTIVAFTEADTFSHTIHSDPRTWKWRKERVRFERR
jgi:hypothetical protein